MSGEDARAEAERRWPRVARRNKTAEEWVDEGRASGFVLGAQWAVAQEPTDAEVEAAARAIHINTIREFDDLGGLDQHALRTRARKALSAARAARRDEEKRYD